MSQRAVLAIPLFALLACAEQPAPATSDTTGSPAATSADIAAVRDAWLAAAARDDAAAVAAMYTDDAIFVATEAPAARGRAAIQQALAESFPISTIDTVDSREVVVSGDVAYDYGEFRQTVTPPNGAAQTVRGHYVVTLRRQPDGSWKLSKHVSTTPPAAAAQP
ncbi:MAG: SgcJ/EcaC family oxidoreductase [Gemmatimonadaceae bacterium]